MMFRHAFVAALVAAAATAPALAADEPGATKAAPPAKEKKICRRELTTGSMMMKSTCRTKAEWDAIAADSQASADRFIQDSSRSTASH